MDTHRLKTEKQFFEQVWSLSKTFELRKSDRDFKVGDRVILEEIENKLRTGREFEFSISHVLSDVRRFGLVDGYCCLSYSPFSCLRIDKENRREIYPSSFIQCELTTEDGPFTEWLLFEEAVSNGYCGGCGVFWAGVTSYDFSPIEGYCENCVTEIQANEYEGDDEHDDLPF